MYALCNVHMYICTFIRFNIVDFFQKYAFLLFYDVTSCYVCCNNIVSKTLRSHCKNWDGRRANLFLAKKSSSRTRGVVAAQLIANLERSRSPVLTRSQHLRFWRENYPFLRANRLSPERFNTCAQPGQKWEKIGSWFVAETSLGGSLHILSCPVAPGESVNWKRKKTFRNVSGSVFAPTIELCWFAWVCRLCGGCLSCFGLHWWCSDCIDTVVPINFFDRIFLSARKGQNMVWGKKILATLYWEWVGVNVIPVGAVGAGGESVIGAQSGPHQLWLGGDCLQFYPPQFD